MAKNGTSIQRHEMAFQDVQFSYAGNGIPRTPTYGRRQTSLIAVCPAECGATSPRATLRNSTVPSYSTSNSNIAKNLGKKSVTYEAQGKNCRFELLPGSRFR